MAFEVIGFTLSAQGGGQTPTVDAGFPSSNWLNNVTPGPTVTTPTFTTGGATRTLIAVVSWYSPSNDTFPATLAWVGGTPANATAWTLVQESTEGTIHWGTQIWKATATAVLTSVSVIASRRTPSDRSTAILSVYSIAGARTSLGATAEHHSTAQDVTNNIYVTDVEVSITATANNSLLIGISQYGDFFSSSTANALTTIDYQQNDGGSDGGAAAWHKTTTTAASSNYTLGVHLPAGNTRAYSGCVVEVLAP